MEPRYSPWIYVESVERVIILKELLNSYKKIRAAAAADEKGLDIRARDAMCIQISIAAQAPRNFLSKVLSPI